MIFRKRRPPDPPKNVKLHFTDGTEIPLECVFVGRDKQKVAHWEVVTQIRTDKTLSHVSVDVVPARTSIAFPGSRINGGRYVIC